MIYELHKTHKKQHSFVPSNIRYKQATPPQHCKTHSQNINDILIIYRKEHNIPSIAHKLNQVEPNINFTYQLEKNNSLSFLDVFLINNNNKLEFKVYHKINDKNDNIHFYSNQSNKTKKWYSHRLFPECP